jgi:NAD(P)-dependent dehydrogenase (short-subunit alcohol dehydrogenase family)
MKLPKNVLVVGASTGIGNSIATYLCNKGHKVIGTSRNPDKCKANYKMAQLDVTFAESIKDCLQKAFSELGGIDSIINCAGYGLAGPIEETTQELLKEQFETNFFGAAELTRQAVKLLREQFYAGGNKGKLIHVTSIAGIVGVPFQSQYCASKFALEGLIESVSAEIYDDSVKLVMIEPGDFKSDFGINRKKANVEKNNAKDAEREKVYIASLGVMEKSETGGPDPIKIARLAEKIINSKNPKLRYPVGSSLELLAVSLKNILPQRSYESLIKGNYSVKKPK